MWRLLIAFSLLCVTTIVMAADPTVPMSIPSFFKPVPDDLSIWFLGNIFGSDLIQGDRISDIKLLSRVFGMFNQVALTVGMIIVVYTIIAGSLNTAHEGKPLGEKWNSVWMPVRTSLGIAMLVPKGGSGYCMAQYLVMWLTLQGVGAADTVWGTMLDYFQQGGAIYSGTSGNSVNYLNANSVDPLYALGTGVRPDGCSQRICPDKTPLIANMACIENFNQDTATQELTGVKQYEIYAPDTSNRPDLIYFGNRAAADKNKLPTGNSSDSIPGAECGYVMVGEQDVISKTFKGVAKAIKNQIKPKSTGFNTPENQIYGMATYNYAKTLQPAAKVIISLSKEEPASDSQISLANDDIRHGVQLFVNYIAGYAAVLSPPPDTNRRTAIDALRQYGWILAGNYYSILSAYKEDAAAISGKYVAPAFPPPGYQAPANLSDAPYAQALKDYMSQLDNWGNDQVSDEDDLLNFHDMPGFGDKGDKAGSVTGKQGKGFIGIVDTEKLIKAITRSGDPSGKTKGKKKGKSGNVQTVKMTDHFMRMMSGVSTDGREVSKDPILRASEYGKTLTDAAVSLFGIFLATTLGFTLATSSMSWVSSAAFATLAVNNILTPPMLALGAFMYTGGAMLGIFLPLIPAISFLTAAIGWLLQCIESIAAAPLVAIGLIMPDSKDEIWGRAAPAYMLTLNLFLRPSLMIVGFGAAMIVTWILVSLLNITFLILLNVSFKIEGAFGFVTILMVYSGLLLYMVTEAYSLVVMVPNKVLHWIGDQSMGVKGAEQALSGAKADVEKGAAATAAGASHGKEGAAAGGDALEKKQNYRHQQKMETNAAPKPTNQTTPTTPTSGSAGTGGSTAGAPPPGAGGGGGAGGAGTGGGSGGTP